MGFWKSLFDNVFQDYTETPKTKKSDPSFTIDIIPDKNKSGDGGRHVNEIIDAANTGKELKPGEASKIIRLMMPENPIDRLFEAVLNKKGSPFLPETDSNLLKQDVFVVDFKQDAQPKIWEGDVLLYTSKNRLDQGKNFRPNISLDFPTTKTSFQNFLKDLKEGAVVTVNSRTPAVGCFEWVGDKFAYRGLPKAE